MEAGSLARPANSWAAIRGEVERRETRHRPIPGLRARDVRPSARVKHCTGHPAQLGPVLHMANAGRDG